ncbi:MAG: efflux RND transporter permease subunit [Candidatus Hinthialibacter antarcticus]|nr:efflux RND transporter permease subunit [Candidatus Hinthialibacter antarcticus]
MSLTSFSVKNRITTMVVLLIIVVVGIYAYRILPRESFPDITIPNVIVTTPYEGVAPSDIENLITDEIEKKLMSISDVDEIRSYSSEGNSTIIVEFTSDIDIDDALQKVRDKVDEAKGDLPNDLENDPFVDEINLSEFPIMSVIVSGPVGLVRLKELADDLSEDIETITGVLEAKVTGGLEREIRVVYEPERLSAYNLSPTQIMNAVIANNLNTPGGDMDIGPQNYLVKIPGEFDDPNEASGLIIRADKNRPIFITDVARLQDGFEEQTTKARYNGREAVSIDVIKRSGENIILIADAVKALLKEYQPGLPEGVAFSIVSDQSSDVRTMVSDLENSILTGLVLVVAVVFFAMGLRNSMLVASAIPLSMLITFFILWILDITLNMVVLFSLVLAVGMLVDNAIVIVENVYRHCQDEGRTKTEASIVATHEVMWPVIASTATTVAAFFPLIFWPGMTGEFMKFLPKTVIITLIASLFVALVINPTLASMFIKVKPKKVKKKPLGLFMRTYQYILEGAIERPFFTLCCAFSVMALVMTAYGRFGHGVEFFPAIDPPRAFVDLKMPKGSNLEQTDIIARRVEEFASEHQITSIVTSVGAVSTGIDAFFGGGGGAKDKGRIMLEFPIMEKRETPAKQILATLRRQTQPIYECDIEINEEEGGPPTGAPVSIEISGESYDVLAPLMRTIKDKIRNTPGLVDMKDDYVIARPEIVIDVDKQRAALLGLDTRMVAENVKTAIRGVEAGKYRDGSDEYDIIVQLPLERRKDLEALKNLQISDALGNYVPITSVADLRVSAGLGTIVHSDQDRVITIEADAEGRLATEVLADVQLTLADMQLPRGYKITYRGESEDREEAQVFLTEAFAAVLMLIALILVTEFNSLYRPLIVLTSVILSTAGVFIGLMATQTPFGIIMTGIGVISLAGVVVNNAIVLLDYIEQLRERGQSAHDSIINACIIRFRPVILTAITTILGLAPMALGISYDFRRGGFMVGTESSQWWGSMAVAVIFGLAFATVMTLVVVPSMLALGDRCNEMVARLRGRDKATSEPVHTISI